MPAYNIPTMEKETFSLWQSMLEKKTGMWLPETRKAFLVTSLNRHMREIGLNDYREYYQMLDRGLISSLEWAKLVDSLTVHETCFYRDKDSLNLVVNYCRNKIQSDQRTDHSTRSNLQIWSVGCSTGEETYTLAIEMEKLKANIKESGGYNVYYGVTGIDVSYPSLAIARDGIYTEKHKEFIPDATVNHYFDRLADGHIQVNRNIRQRTCFIQSNILEMESGFNQLFDVIYCQNVMIYFRTQKKEAVIKKLIKRLAPSGLLVFGHGEITSTQSTELTRVDNKQCLAFVKTATSASCTNQITSIKSEFA